MMVPSISGTQHRYHGWSMIESMCSPFRGLEWLEHVQLYYPYGVIRQLVNTRKTSIDHGLALGAWRYVPVKRDQEGMLIFVQFAGCTI